MSSTVDVLPGPGTVCRQGEIGLWLGDDVPVALATELLAAVTAGAGMAGPDVLATLGQLLVDLPPGAIGSLGAVAVDAYGSRALLHGSAFVQNGRGEGHSSALTSRLLDVSIAPDGLIGLWGMSSTPPTVGHARMPFDLQAGTVPGGGFLVRTEAPTGERPASPAASLVVDPPEAAAPRRPAASPWPDPPTPLPPPVAAGGDPTPVAPGDLAPTIDPAVEVTGPVQPVVVPPAVWDDRGPTPPSAPWGPEEGAAPPPAAEAAPPPVWGPAGSSPLGPPEPPRAPGLRPGPNGVPEPLPPVAPSGPGPGMRLLDLDAPPLEDRAPLSIVKDVVGEPPPVDEPRSVREVVQGIRCVNGHFNHQGMLYCRACGIGMVQQSAVLVESERPSLGVIVMGDGATFSLDDEYLLGREPSRDAGQRTIVIDDKRVSRRHALLSLQGWDVLVTDLGSSNGTYIKNPGWMEWLRTTPQQPTNLEPGGQIGIGGQILVYESSARR